MAGPLDHIRAVEMTIAIQGPGAGLFLRDMGAEVIKVEPPVGDASRYHRGVGNNLPQETLGSQFVAMNRGKKSVCVDVNTDLGRAAVLKLLETADVFLSNFRLAALEKMGLGFETVHALNPRLVYATANGFGPEGPDAGKMMLDGAAIARGGLASMTGEPDRGPIAPGAAVADSSGAMQFALSIVTALVARDRDGVGQHVQCSALGAQLWLQQWELTHVWMTGHQLPRSGAHHANIHAPYGVYETSDGEHFLFAVAWADECWDAFWVFADDPAEAMNPKWDAQFKRLGQFATLEDALEIQAKMREAFKKHTAAEWDSFLAGQPDIVYERVRNYEDVRNDPQNLANGYVETVDLPGVGETSLVGNLLHFSGTPPDPRALPPGLGDDTRSILGELGVADADIDEMVEHADRERETVFAQIMGK